MSVAELALPADSDLPEGWMVTTIGQAFHLNPPKPPLNILPADAPVTFVPMPAVDANSGTISAPLQRLFSEVRSGFTAFAENDVIMAKITPCMENGKATVTRGLINGLGFGSTEFHVLRPIGVALPEFVYHFIRQESFRSNAEKEMTGSVGQRRVPTDFLRNAEIPLPPLAEQRRIVAKLEQLVTAAIASRERLARVPLLMKRFRQSVLAAACSGRLTADWREQNPNVEPASQLLEHILTERRAKWQSEQVAKKRGKQTNPQTVLDIDDVSKPDILTLNQGIQGSSQEHPRLFSRQFRYDVSGYKEPAAPDTSELPELPESWHWGNFGSLLSELKNGIGTKPAMDGPGTPMLRISSVRPGKVLLDEYRFLPDADALLSIYSLQDGDLLFTRYNGSLDLLAVCGMVRGLGQQTRLYPDKLMRVRFDHEGIMPHYIEIYFQSPDARERITARAKSSAGQQGISGEDVKAQCVAIPPLAEQQEIVRRVEALFKFADAVEKRTTAAIARADKLTQAILAKAFRGELVPTEAELARAEGRDYEPAAALLARIQAERNVAPKTHAGRGGKNGKKPAASTPPAQTTLFTENAEE